MRSRTLLFNHSLLVAHPIVTTFVYFCINVVALRCSEVRAIPFLLQRCRFKNCVIEIIFWYMLIESTVRRPGAPGFGKTSAVARRGGGPAKDEMVRNSEETSRCCSESWLGRIQDGAPP